MARDERLLPLPTAAEVQVKAPNPAAARAMEGPTTYAPVYDADPFAEKRSVREYFNVVRKRKWMILALVTIVTLSTALYMYRQPSEFQGTAQVLVEARSSKQSDKNLTLNLWYDPRYWETQVKLIQNPDLMRDAVILLGLHRSPTLPGAETGPGLFGVISGKIFGNKPSAENSIPQTVPIITDAGSVSDGTNVQLTPEEQRRAEEYGKALLGGLGINPVEKTNLIDLSYKSNSKELAKDIPNAVAAAFIAQDMKREMQGSLQAVEENAKAIEGLRQTINGLEQQRIEFLQRAGIPVSGTKGSINPIQERLTKYSSQLLEADDEVSKFSAQYSSALKAQQSGDTFSMLALSENQAIQKAREINRQRISDMKKRIEDYNKVIAQLKQKKAQLLVKYTEEYFEVKQIDEEIKTVEQSRDEDIANVKIEIEKDDEDLKQEAEKEVLTGIKAKLDAAQKRAAVAQGNYARELAAANIQGQSEIKLISLTQEIESNRKLYDNALQRQKELELAAGNSRPNNIKVSSVSQGSTQVGPKRVTNVFIAFLVSLAGGIGLAFLLDYLDDSVKSSDDIGRHLGLPTLALIPHQGSLERSIMRGRLAASNSAPAASNAMIALDDSRSAVAEAYRHLRTSLLFSSAGKPPQTILVTSSQPSEGKTTTAINTAITLAQAGADVVIIDCDLRRPRLHHHFEMDNNHGLTNFLSGERNVSELLKTCDKLPNLKVVTCGPIPPNPAELLGSNEMRNLIEFLRTNFKHVVIDSPPAISFTDAAILSTLVDGVVIVAMAGKSSIHMIRRFKQRLSTMGTRIYGVVLNGLKRNSLDYGYGYYGYGYNYYSYYNDEENADGNPESNGNGSKNGKSNGNGNGDGKAV